MSFESWMGVEGKPRMMVYCVMIMLLVIVAFTIYSVIYTIPDAAVEKACLELYSNDCDKVEDMYGYCQMVKGDYIE